MPGFVKRSKAWNKISLKDFSKQGIEKLIRNATMNVLGHTENHGISSFPFDLFRSGNMGKMIRKNMYDVLRFRTTFEKGEPEQILADFERVEMFVSSLREELKGHDKLWSLQIAEILVFYHSHCSFR